MTALTNAQREAVELINNCGRIVYYSRNMMKRGAPTEFHVEERESRHQAITNRYRLNARTVRALVEAGVLVQRKAGQYRLVQT